MKSTLTPEEKKEYYRLHYKKNYGTAKGRKKKAEQMRKWRAKQKKYVKK